MAIERLFMGWDQPALQLAVAQLWRLSDGEHLLKSHRTSSDQASGLPSSGTTVDMSRLLVVVAGSRAGQRLLELLVARSNSEQVRFIPPRITTVGALPEFLYRAQRPFASPAAQQLAWTNALRRLEPSTLQHLLPEPEEIHRADDWLEIAQLLARLARELGDEGLNFSDVLAHGRQINGGRSEEGSSADALSFPEVKRWESLNEIQAKYLEVLDDVGLWDRQTARLVALQRGEKELKTDHEIVLVGTVDLGLATRKMLKALDSRILSLVFAPAQLASRFDALGCLLPETWKGVAIPIEDDQILLADAPIDQATALLHAIGSKLTQRSSGKRQGDESNLRDKADVNFNRPAFDESIGGLDSIGVSIADARLVPSVERRCQAIGQSTRWLGGVPIADTLPIRFLAAVAAYLERHWYVEFAALVRHPDVKDWLSRSIDNDSWLDALDEFQNQRLPLEISESLFGTRSSQNRSETSTNGDQVGLILEPVAQQLFDRVAELLTPLRQPSRTWVGVWQAIREVLLTLYGDRVVDRDGLEGRKFWGALRQINKTLDELAQLPAALHLTLHPSEAIRFLLSVVQRESIGLPTGADELELMGWLDIPWDDAPHAFVLGFNEGVVPSSESAELFLSDRVRAELGLIDSSRRYARDAYAVNLLIHSRVSVQFIVGRRDTEDNPLVPSRLLFSVTAADIGPRALSLFREAPTRLWSPGKVSNEGSTGFEERLKIPEPSGESQVLTRLSVTRFADYLTCPYRFYLNHVLRLKSVDDQVDEIPGNDFGTLMHDLLDDFGKSSLKGSQDPVEIEEFLMQRLDRKIARKFARLVLPTVPIQLGQLRRRLSAFAQAQAQRASEGWEIWLTEVTELQAELQIDEEPFWITGRIDRIDFHPENGHYALLDYKSSEKAKTPEATHREKGEWVNLQLPLYRHLASEIEDLDGPIRLGFFVLPKDVSDAGILEAKWSPGELEQADERAEEVVRALRERRFWPPRELPDRWEDPLARICQVGVFGRISQFAQKSAQETQPVATAKNGRDR